MDSSILEAILEVTHPDGADDQVREGLSLVLNKRLGVVQEGLWLQLQEERKARESLEVKIERLRDVIADLTTKSNLNAQGE